jgi:hypothetical protein
MADVKKASGTGSRRTVSRALKATMKGILFCGLYLFLWPSFQPFATLVPGLAQSIETFVIVYITLMIVGDLLGGTVYQHFFGAAKALLVIGYLILTLKGGMVGATYQNISLLVDIRLFLVMAMLFSLLDLAKSVFQAINYMCRTAENAYF